MTTEIVITAETMIELPSASQKGMASSTLPAFARKLPPGSSGSVSARVWLVPLPTTNDHQSG